MIELYIDNKAVELDEKITIPVTKQFESLTNPTTIIGEYSNTIKIPCTPANNRLFGCFWHLDTAIVAGGYTGIYFDATKQIPYQLLLDGAMVMDGYLKVNSVDHTTGGKQYYNVQLFGKLGQLFYELKKLSFNPDAVEDEKYLIANPMGQCTLNSALIKRSWDNTTNATTTDPIKWIGFAPTNQGLYNDFDTKSVQNSTNTTTAFATIVNQMNNVEITDIDSIIGDGLDELQYNEFRTYYQQPYIYVKPLFNLLAKECKRLTGYQLKFTGDWFTSTNPNWENLVYFTPKFDLATTAIDGEGYTITGATSVYDANPMNYTYLKFDWDGETATTANGQVVYYTLDTSKTTKLKVKIKGCFLSKKQPTNLCANVDLRVGGATTGAEQTGTFYNHTFTFKFPNYDGETTGDVVNYTPNWVQSTRFGGYYSTEFTITDSFVIPNTTTRFSLGLNVLSTPQPLMVFVEPLTGNTIEVGYNKNTRHNRPLAYNDIVGADFVPFDLLIKYIKMYNLCVDVNEQSKVITINNKADYFADYAIKDWTDKVDTSKQFLVQPITFDHKNIVFNYTNTGGEKGVEYADQYGYGYGAKKVETSYNFDSSDQNLFEGLTTAVPTSPVVYGWNQMAEISLQKYINNNTWLENNGDVLAGAFAYRCPNQAWDTQQNANGNDAFRKFHISDDTNYQASHENYMYVDGSITNGYRRLTSMPRLDIVKDGFGCLFNRPNETYTYDNAQGDAETKYIYNLCWRDWIEERYNINNKKVTAYFYLTKADYNQFRFNQFVKVGTGLYFVNKIENYAYNDEVPTKVELLQISDVTKYRTGQINPEFMQLRNYQIGDVATELEKVGENNYQTSIPNGTATVLLPIYDTYTVNSYTTTNIGGDAVIEVKTNNGLFADSTVKKYLEISLSYPFGATTQQHLVVVNDAHGNTQRVVFNTYSGLELTKYNVTLLDGGADFVGVVGNSATITATPNVGWITTAVDGGGVSISAQPNLSAYNRTGYVRISDGQTYRDIYVFQSLPPLRVQENYTHVYTYNQTARQIQIEITSHSIARVYSYTTPSAPTLGTTFDGVQLLTVNLPTVLDGATYNIVLQDAYMSKETITIIQDDNLI